MPTYQYACRNTECGNQFELVQSFTDPAASECPVCGGPVRKVFSAVGVVFKGSGFYRTDSRSSSNGDAKSEASPATAKSEGSPNGTKSEGSSGAAKSEGSSGSSGTSGSSGPATSSSSASGSTSSSPAPAA